MTAKIAVLVAGSWGTALSEVLAQNGHHVYLWTRNLQQAATINDQHRNDTYLSTSVLHTNIYATCSMKEAMMGANVCIVAAPSAIMRHVASMMKPYWTNNMIVVHATKGFETETRKRMSEVLQEELACDLDQIAVLSGPSHAEEVIKQYVTTVVIASTAMKTAQQAQNLFMNDSFFRVYTNTDIVGVELAGALKNVIALGVGLADGLQLGDNSKAALMTRGLAEITRLGVAMGAKALTFAGLAGVGDVIVTCTSQHSRNWRAGFLLGQGMSVENVLLQMGMVVEGVRTTKAAYLFAANYDVEMPVVEQLHQVLFADRNPKIAIECLMGRMRQNE